MGRGGKRKGAGRISTWHSATNREDTTTIRVPKYLKEEILYLAHKLDQNYADKNLVTILSDRWNGKYKGTKAKLIRESKVGYDVEMDTGKIIFFLKGEIKVD